MGWASVQESGQCYVRDSVIVIADEETQEGCGSLRGGCAGWNHNGRDATGYNPPEPWVRIGLQQRDSAGLQRLAVLPLRSLLAMFGKKPAKGPGPRCRTMDCG